MHHGFPLQAVCGEFASHWDPGLAVMGFFLITQRTSNALCVMWDQKSHAGEVVLKTNNHTTTCWRRKTSAGWFQTIWSFSSSAKDICIWLESIQLCSLSCHSCSQCSEYGQKKVTLLQKAFHTLKPVNAKNL